MAITAYTFDEGKAAAYLDLCSRLYKQDTNWIVPLRSRALSQFSREFFFYREGGNAHRHFLATTAGRQVGHASAFVPSKAKNATGQSAGLIGFFECVDDDAVASDLLGQAIDWMRAEHSIRRVWAPMQFDVWHGYRFMTRGFQERSFFGEPYNKPYYPGMFSQQGFEVCKRWYSLEIASSRQLRKLIAPCKEAYDRAVADGYRFLSIDVHDHALMASLQSAIESSYQNFLGLAPLAPDQFKKVVEAYAEALDPRFAIVAIDPAGVLSGFAIAYPDYAHALNAMHGSESLIARLSFYLRARRIRRAVFFMIGITPTEARRRRGIGHALHYRCLDQLLAAGFETIVFALLAEDSPGWRLVENRKEEAQKEYALYEAVFEP